MPVSGVLLLLEPTLAVGALLLGGDQPGLLFPMRKSTWPKNNGLRPDGAGHYVQAPLWIGYSAPIYASGSGVRFAAQAPTIQLALPDRLSLPPGFITCGQP